MTRHLYPIENAIAERVNGILKDEWLNDVEIKKYPEGKKDTDQN